MCVFTIFFTTFVGRLFFFLKKPPICLHLFLSVLLFNAAFINGIVLSFFIPFFPYLIFLESYMFIENCCWYMHVGFIPYSVTIFITYSSLWLIPPAKVTVSPFTLLLGYFLPLIDLIVNFRTICLSLLNAGITMHTAIPNAFVSSLIMVVLYYNPNSWESGEDPDQVQGQPGLHCSFYDNLGLHGETLSQKTLKIYQ